MAYKFPNGVTQSEHEGKMLGIPSISTCCLTNPICLARMQNGDSVCAKCYSATYMGFRKPLREAMERNLELLSDHIFTAEELDGMTIHFTQKMRDLNPEMYARTESFGDVRNDIQAINYMLIHERNPEYKWGAWTKNDFIWGAALEKLGRKPSNLSLGYSSPKVNEVADISKLHPIFVDNLDFVFTVFTKEYAKAHGIEINCGGLACRLDGKCYTANEYKARTGHVLYINEILK